MMLHPFAELQTAGGGLFRQCCLALFDSFSGDVKGSSEFQESLESNIQQQETEKLH